MHAIEDNSKGIDIDELVEHCLVYTNHAESLDKFFNWDLYLYDYIESNEKDSNLEILAPVLS